MGQGSRFLPCVLLAVPLLGAGCIQQLGTDIANTDPSSAAGGSSTDDASIAGSGCSLDPTTQVTLCSGIAECPSITVDPSALNGCGFRVHPGSALMDLECLCGGYLCPIGVPDTCDQASSLLNGLTSIVVCEQASEGKCVEEVAPEAGTGTTTGATTTSTSTTSPTSTCNSQCLVSCGAAPDCQLLCGC